MKHLFTALLLLCCVGMAKAHDFEAGGIYYNILSSTDNSVEVTYRGDYYHSYNNEYTGSVVIPESVNYNGITYSVTSIGSLAFQGCYGLTSITIPNSVTSIGDYAFSDCSGLTSITIPNSVTSIGLGALRGCSGLTSIEIPNSVTSIGGQAFMDCSGLTSVVIGNGVTSIGGYAFYYCSGLTSITIPNNVTSIGNYAFEGCDGLTSIEIPNSVTSIGRSAFYNTAWYNNQPDGFVYAGKVLYKYKGAMPENTSIVINDGTLGIAGGAFYGCKGLTSITIPNSVTSIGSQAFYGCKGLTSITIPNSVTSIGDDAFYGCKGLISIEIPNSVTSIESYAFEGTAWYNNQPDGVVYAGKVLYKYKGTMPSNTSITIKDETLGIAGGAFYNCSDLTSITIPNSVTSIGDGAFSGCTGLKTVINFSNLTFSEGSEDYGRVACYADKVYNVPNGSKEGDFIFGKPNDVNTLLYYLGNATELTLPANYKGGNYTIGANVFKGNTTITSVTIPNSVTSIDDDAFAGCTNIEKLYLDCAEIGDWLSGVSAMKEVTIGNGVTTVVASAFNGCTGLEKVCINDLVAWCGIDFGSADANPLYYAKNLYLNGELLTSLTIPAEVAEVKDYAFYNCNGVTIIDIVDGVESIGNSAFYGCSDLETLYISNTIESIGDYAFAECNNLFDIKIGAKKAITASENVFSRDAYNNACLYVPTGRKDFYAKTSPWSNFIIREMDFTGIEDVEAEGERIKDVYYDLSGRVVENPTNGVYIIDGKKVLIK